MRRDYVECPHCHAAFMWPEDLDDHLRFAHRADPSRPEAPKLVVGKTFSFDGIARFFRRVLGKRK